jgi:hypothetical protein
MGLGEAKSMERRLIKNFNPNLNWEYKKAMRAPIVGMQITKQDKGRAYTRPPPKLRSRGVKNTEGKPMQH